MAAKKQPAKRADSRATAVKGKKQTKAAKRPAAKARPKGQPKAQPKSKGSKSKVLNVWSYDAQGNR